MFTVLPRRSAAPRSALSGARSPGHTVCLYDVCSLSTCPPARFLITFFYLQETTESSVLSSAATFPPTPSVPAFTSCSIPLRYKSVSSDLGCCGLGSCTQSTKRESAGFEIWDKLCRGMDVNSNMFSGSSVPRPPAVPFLDVLLCLSRWSGRDVRHGRYNVPQLAVGIKKIHFLAHIRLLGVPSFPSK